MTDLVSRRLRPFWLAASGGVLCVALVGPTVQAQTVQCYFKRCVEFPDGTRVCERTPIDCASVVL